MLTSFLVHPSPESSVDPIFRVESVVCTTLFRCTLLERGGALLESHFYDQHEHPINSYPFHSMSIYFKIGPWNSTVNVIFQNHMASWTNNNVFICVSMGHLDITGPHKSNELNNMMIVNLCLSEIFDGKLQAQNVLSILFRILQRHAFHFRPFALVIHTFISVLFYVIL